ncbi:Plant self-incompatibility response [Arabidopsis suecica]|uniref:Plant self-incompatibility response n=1 Tax=Arabidopsis suecica TaxID=45249 RepID=A0A8T2HF11_ARASU|nr:Plant self-incompatibility response [Arabidopsis suecica]
MKFVAIFLVTCVLFSLFPSHLSQGEESKMNINAERRPWCPSKIQMFDTNCEVDGAKQCLDLLISTWDPSVRLTRVSCICSDFPYRNMMCSCPNMICP